ncbi:hypothetical protein PaeCFBP13512_23020 [Paenibacillus sp. CFBP13512]|uniref:AbrB/MazE/SpoVT family DNA-binding domain-containing protein n=1 Tax=Paenibacillus sp. CFBP13512 TaxID=2184007 RepID=UPI0010BFBB72|nr:AbrB/MazE/SpoVT family DNA-binding domain-containing protein [Paenibacillus sp. CFBP13512]TKJ83300.1 hypothetical protein PaeCFBP13512_23020 [Paenibacillus sp. CFBP13512]
MFKSTISSKGQVTIPKEIRDHLNLIEGDTVGFQYDPEGKVYLDKQIIFRDCPVCFGSGKIDTDNKACYMCDEKKVIPNNIFAFKLIHEVQWRKYRISYTLIHHATDSNKEVYQLSIPVFSLRSDLYGSDSLAAGNDYIQMKLIQEYAPRRVQDPEQYAIPSDIVLAEITSLLTESSSKREVTSWFRA